MKHLIAPLAIGLLLCAPLAVDAAYFTIELKNGSTMDTEKYWEDGQVIRFFTQGGTVALPKQLIANIIQNDGTIGGTPTYFSTDFIDAIESDLEPETENEAEPAAFVTPPPKERDQALIDDLQDRLAVIQTNLANLQRNQQTFTERRDRAVTERDRLEARIREAQRDTLTTDNSRTLAREQERLEAVSGQIETFDTQLQNIEQMRATQQRMQQRIEAELQRLPQP